MADTVSQEIGEGIILYKKVEPSYQNYEVLDQTNVYRVSKTNILQELNIYDYVYRLKLNLTKKLKYSLTLLAVKVHLSLIPTNQLSPLSSQHMQTRRLLKLNYSATGCSALNSLTLLRTLPRVRAFPNP